MSDVRHRSPWEAADCPECGRGLFVDEHSSGNGWICHDCEIRFQRGRAMTDGGTAELPRASPSYKCECGARYYGKRAARACCPGRDVTEVES